MMYFSIFTNFEIYPRQSWPKSHDPNFETADHFAAIGDLISRCWSWWLPRCRETSGEAGFEARGIHDEPLDMWEVHLETTGNTLFWGKKELTTRVWMNVWMIGNYRFSHSILGLSIMGFHHGFVAKLLGTNRRAIG